MSFVEVKVMIYFDRSGWWVAKSVLTKFFDRKEQILFSDYFCQSSESDAEKCHDGINNIGFTFCCCCSPNLLHWLVTTSTAASKLASSKNEIALKFSLFMI